MARVSVPLWLAVLSDQLLIEALVSHYLTNKLIRRRLIIRHITALTASTKKLHYAVLANLSTSYSPPNGR